MTIKYYVEGLNGFDIAIEANHKNEMAIAYEIYNKDLILQNKEAIEIKLNSLDEMKTLYFKLLESDYLFTATDLFVEALYTLEIDKMDFAKFFKVI